MLAVYLPELAPVYLLIFFCVPVAATLTFSLVFKHAKSVPISGLIYLLLALPECSSLISSPASLFHINIVFAQMLTLQRFPLYPASGCWPTCSLSKLLNFSSHPLALPEVIESLYNPILLSFFHCV